MDKIRQAIERSRNERESQQQSSSLAPTSSVRVDSSALRAGIPFEPDSGSMALAQLLPANDHGSAAKALRMLRTIVLQKMRERGWRTIGVVSSHASDGKSTLAGNLAIAIATDPRSSAVLVDLDIDAPWLSRGFGVPEGPGLAAALLGDAELDHCLFAPTGTGRLTVMPLSDGDQEVSRDIVALPSLATTLKALTEQTDSIVVVDLPAVLDSDGALTAATLCDCLLYAVREGTTRRADLERGIGLLAAVPILGTVLMDSLTAPAAEAVKA